MVLVVILGVTYRYILLMIGTAEEMFESRRSRMAGKLEAKEARRLAVATAGVLLSKTMQLLRVWALLRTQALGDNPDVTAVVDAIPLARDAQGAYRVGGTRVTLDLVVRAFNRGATVEEIVQKYDGLQLSDVYQVIGYYLKHADELAEYFENRAREEEGLLSSHPEWAPAGLGDRLLARRKSR